MHYQGHLRDAFIELVEGAQSVADLFYDDATRSRLEAMTRCDQFWWLSGKLWHCTDIMPSAVCAELELPHGSTYAQAAQGIRRGAILPAGLRVAIG